MSETMSKRSPNHTSFRGACIIPRLKEKSFIGIDSETGQGVEAFQIWKHAWLLVQQLIIHCSIGLRDQFYLNSSPDNEKKYHLSDYEKKPNRNGKQVVNKTKVITVFALTSAWMTGLVKGQTGIIAEIGNLDVGVCATNGVTFDSYKNDGVGSGETWQTKLLVTGYTLSKSLLTGNPAATGCLPTAVGFVRQYTYTGVPGTDATLQFERFLTEIYWWVGGNQAYMYRPNTGKYEMTNVRTETNNDLDFVVISKLYWHTNGGQYGDILLQMSSTTFAIKVATLLHYQTSYWNRVHPINDAIGLAKVPGQTTIYQLGMCQHQDDPYDWTYHQWNMLYINTASRTIQETEQRYFSSTNTNRGCTFYHATPRFHISAYRWGYSSLLFEYRPATNNRLTWLFRHTESYSGYTVQPRRIVQDQSSYNAGNMLTEIRWMIGEPTTDYTAYTIKNIDSTWYGRAWIWRWSPTFVAGVHMIQAFAIDLQVVGNTFLNSFYGQILALEVHDPDMIVAHVTISSASGNLGRIGSQLNKIVSFQLERSYEQIDSTSGLHYYKVASLPSTYKFTGGYYPDAWSADHQISAVGGKKKYAKAWGSSCYSTAGTPPCYVNGIQSYYGWPEDVIYMATTTTKFQPTSDTTFSEGLMDSATLSGSQVNTNGGQNSILIASSRKHTAKRDQFSAKIWSSGLLELTTNTLGHRKYGYWCGCDISYDNNQYGDFVQWNPNGQGWGNHYLHTTNIAFKDETDFGQYTTYLTTLSGLTPTYWMQWPNNTVVKTQFINSLYVSHSSGNWHNYYPSSNINEHGHLPNYRFAIKTPTGYYSQGWYDHSVQQFRFDPPIDQNAIIAARVTKYEIVGGNTHGSTWYFMSKFCLSSGVQWKQPELATCMGVSDATIEDSLNKVFQTGTNDQNFLNVAGSTITDTAPAIATKECSTTESFTVNSLAALNVDVVNLPQSYTQSQLVTNGNWVNSVQMINVVLLDSSHLFYTEVPWNPTTQMFEFNNKISELNRIRDSEQMYLLVYQRTCAKIQATPTNSWVNLALNSLNLMAQEIPLTVTISDCKSVSLIATKPLVKNVAYPNVGGLLFYGSVQTNFVSGDPTRCPHILAWYEIYDAATQQYVLYSANGDLSKDNLIGTGWGQRQATDPPFTVGYTKRLWVTSKNKAGVTARYEVIMKMCGLEVTATPVTTALEYKFFKNYNSGTVNTGSVSSNLLITSTDDAVDCPFNLAYIEIDTPSLNTLFAANNDNTQNVYIDTSNNLIIKTATTYSYTPLYVTAITKGNVKQRYPINIKICGAEVLGLAGTTVNPLKRVYVKNEGYLNLINLGSIASLYTNTDSVDCPITSYNVYTSTGVLFSAYNDATKLVYVNSQNELIVQTGMGAFNSYSTTSSLRIMAWSAGVKSTYFLFDVKVCGLETPVATSASLTFGPYSYAETTAGELTGIIKTTPSVTSYFTNPDPIDCPIVDFFVEKGVTPGTLYSANGDSNNDVFVTSSPYDLKVMTILPWAPFTKTDLYLTTVTKGGTKVRIPMQIKVCGAETIPITPPTAPYPYYIYSKGIGLMTNFDIDNVMASTDAQCPTVQKYIEQETVGAVYSANNDNTKDMYLDVNGVLKINTAASFDKYIWPTIITKGNIKNRVRVRVKVCGLETITTSITTAPKYIYALNYNAGSVNLGSIFTNFWNSDNGDCPMTIYIEDAAGNTYSTNNQVASQFYVNSLNQLIIKTNVPYGNTLYVTALTIGQQKIRYPIYIKICGAETVNHIFAAITPNTNFGVYAKDENSGLKQVINIATHFSTTDNIECPINTWWITYNDATPTLFSNQGDTTKNVYIDSNLNVQVKTSVPAVYNVLRLYARSIGLQQTYYTFYLRVCGTEAVQTPATQADQIRWYTDFTPSLGAGLFQTLTSIQTLFTHDTECPFVDYFLEIGAVPGTLYSANGDSTKDVYLTSGLTPNLIQQTINPFAPYNKILFITGVTKGNVKSRIQIRVKVCGAETIMYLTTGVPQYIYGPGDTSGTNLASPGDMDVLYMKTSDDIECPLTEKFVELETNGLVFSAQNDATKSVYVDTNGFVFIKTNLGPTDQFYWITGNSKGDIKGRQKIRVKVCGAETIKATLTLQPTWTQGSIYKVFNYNEQNGNAFYTSVQPSISPLNEVFDNSDQTECPILTYQIENATPGSVYTVMNSGTGKVYATNTGDIRVRTSPTYAPFNNNFWITAITKGLIKARYEVRIKVCGAEVVTQTSAPTIFIYQRYSSTNTLINLKQFSISNDYECPISYWSLHELVGATYNQINNKDGVISSYSFDSITVKTQIPMEYTVYIKTGTTTPATITTSRVYVPLRIKVCGFENVRQVQTTEPNYFYRLWTGVQVMADVKTWFTNNDTTECPIEKYEILLDQGKLYDGQIVAFDSAYNIFTKTQQTINQAFIVKATSKGMVTAYQKFTIQMCGAEMLSLSKSSIEVTSDRTTDSNNIFVTISGLDKYFVNSNSKECPTSSYGLYKNTTTGFQPFTSGNVLWDPVSKNIQYQTQSSYREQFYVKAMTIGGVYIYLPIDILICGNEQVVYVNQKQENAFVVSYNQFTGSERNTQTVVKERYMSMVKSNNIRCLINDKLTQILYDDYTYSPPDLNKNYTNTSRIKFDANSGDLTVNTFEPFNETLKIMVMTNSSKPFYIPMNVSVVKKPAPVNRKPYFIEPGPEIHDVIINETKDVYRYVFDVSKVYDDFNEIKWLNISNSALGVWKIKYDLGSQNPNLLNTESHSENCEYSISDFKITCSFYGIKKILKYVGVIYRFSAFVEDYQGLYSQKAMVLNLTLDQDWYYPKNKYQGLPRTEIKEKTVAKIKSISVFGEVDIEFNKSSTFQPKNFTEKQYDYLKSKIHMYIKPADDWTEEVNVKPSLNFTFVIKELTDTNLRIKINFTDPKAVSPSSKYDKLVIYIDDVSSLFDNVIGRRRMLNATIYSMYMEQSIQKQMPDNPEERQLVSILYGLRITLTALLIVSCALACWYRAPLDRILQLLIELQVLGNFALLHVTLPGNVEISGTVFKPFISLNFFKSLLAYQKEDAVDENQKDLEYLGQRMVYNYDTFNVMFNLKSIGIIYCLWLLKVVISLVLYCYFKCTDKSEQNKQSKLKSFIKINREVWLLRTVFQDFLTLFLIGFMEFGIACLLTLTAPRDQFLFSWNVVVAILIGASLILGLPLVYFTLYRDLITGKIDEKLGMLQIGSSSQVRNGKKLHFQYLMIFFGIRYCFLLISFFINKGWIQIMIMIKVFGLGACLFADIKPFNGRWNNRLGLFNICICVLCSYHLIAFTDFADREPQYLMGKSFLIFILVLIIVNLLYFSAELVLVVHHIIYSNISEEAWKKIDVGALYLKYYKETVAYFTYHLPAYQIKSLSSKDAIAIVPVKPKHPFWKAPRITLPGMIQGQNHFSGKVPEIHEVENKVVCEKGIWKTLYQNYKGLFVSEAQFQLERAESLKNKIGQESSEEWVEVEIDVDDAEVEEPDKQMKLQQQQTLKKKLESIREEESEASQSLSSRSLKNPVLAKTKLQKIYKNSVNQDMNQDFTPMSSERSYQIAPTPYQEQVQHTQHYFAKNSERQNQTVPSASNSERSKQTIPPPQNERSAKATPRPGSPTKTDSGYQIINTGNKLFDDPLYNNEQSVIGVDLLGEMNSVSTKMHNVKTSMEEKTSDEPKRAKKTKKVKKAAGLKQTNKPRWSLFAEQDFSKMFEVQDQAHYHDPALWKETTKQDITYDDGKVETVEMNPLFNGATAWQKLTKEKYNEKEK